MPYIVDDGPMWSIDDYGSYWLLFPNKHALTKDEIKEIFSQYGTVQNVTMAGDERGFRFVQYALLEDVERAVENLQNHPTIKLVPYRPKKKNNNQRSNDSQSNNDTGNQQTMMENVRRNLYQRKPLRNKTESSDAGESQFQNATSNEESISLHELTLRERRNSDACSNNDNASVHSVTSSKSSSNKFSNSPNLIKSSKDHLVKLQLLDALASSMTRTSSCSNVNDDEIPELVTKTKLNACKPSKKLILNAEEILVANIHSDYGSAYILHLFERYEPLAVSYINVIPNSEVRYCHVYFKTAQHSLEVETEFDRYNLAGKNLIVLRPRRLMEEATS